MDFECRDHNWGSRRLQGLLSTPTAEEFATRQEQRPYKVDAAPFSVLCLISGLHSQDNVSSLPLCDYTLSLAAYVALAGLR